jgi:hypothetical protein
VVRCISRNSWPLVLTLQHYMEFIAPVILYCARHIGLFHLMIELGDDFTTPMLFAQLAVQWCYCVGCACSCCFSNRPKSSDTCTRYSCFRSLKSARSSSSCSSFSPISSNAVLCRRSNSFICSRICSSSFSCVVLHTYTQRECVCV